MTVDRTKSVVGTLGTLALAGAMLVPQGSPAQAQTSRRYRSTYMRRAQRFVTLVGTLTRDANNKAFTMRSASGKIYKVNTEDFANAEVADKLKDGDRVRVHGRWKNNVLYAKNLRVIISGAPELGRRVTYKSRSYMMGQMNTLQGYLVSDADDDEFEIRANNGVVYMIRTRTIPDSYGLNKLQKGQRVSVHGFWIPNADGGQPQLEAKSVRLR